MSNVHINFVGRILTVSPADVISEELRKTFAVRVRERMLDDNGVPMTGQEDYEWVQHDMHWEDTTPDGTRVFVTYRGYGDRLIQELQAAGHTVTTSDLKPNGLAHPRLELLQGIRWRGSQATVVARICAQSGGVVKCPTGWGKSFVIGCVAKAYPDATIVVTVPSIDVARDLYYRLRQMGLGTVGFVGDSRQDVQRVTVAVTHSIGYCNQKADLVLVDEVHAVLTEHFISKLQLFERARMIGFTATPDRTDGGDGYLEPLFGPLLADVPYQEAVDSGNVVPLVVRRLYCNEGRNVAKLGKKVPAAVKDRIAIWTNLPRNMLIAAAARRAEAEFAPDPQVLIMVSKVEHAYLLQQLLPDYIVVSGAVSEDREKQLKARNSMNEQQVVCTRDDRRRYKDEFSAGTLRKVIATFVWSKGVDFKDLQVLIRADGLASPIQAGQVPGRLSRLGSQGDKPFGLLIDVFDTFSPDYQAKSATRFREYAKHGWPIQEEGAPTGYRP